MMEIPSKTLNKLKCGSCKEFLSRGPILILDDGKNSCGRCIVHKKDARRNLPYEELAKLMAFPCRYKKNGCTAEVLFDNNKKHEEACAYQLYLCPIAEGTQCQWSGKQTNIMKHFQAKHPAFKVLFLIQIKVCVTSKKIYHCVRLIGDPRNAAKYQFIIDIKNKDNKLTTTGNVAPQESLTLNEMTSLKMNIYGFLEILGDFKDTIFTITLRSFDSKNTEKSMKTGTNAEIEKPIKVNAQINCAQCKLLTVRVYQNEELAWLCKACAPARVNCKNSSKGCSYKDIKNKCLKHLYYYCQHSIKCQICEKLITGMSLGLHYTQAHRNNTYGSGTELNITSVCRKLQWCIISTDFGNALCMHKLFPTHFHLDIRTPLPTDQLCLYKCVIKIRDSEQRRILTRTPDVQYNAIADWCLQIPEVEFNLYVHNGKCNINIDFIKI